MAPNIREAWRDFRRKAVVDPLGSISAALAAVVLCYGLWQVGFDFYKAWGWWAVAIYVVIVSGVVFYVLVISEFFNPFKPYKRNLNPDFLYNRVTQHWHINADGSRNVDATRWFVFFQSPKEDDLCDTVYGSLGLVFDELRYESSDANVVKYKSVRSDAYSVFWQPKKGEIEIGELYAHQFSYIYPPGLTALQKSITISSRVPVFEFDLLITTDRKIQRIEVKKNDELIKFWNEADIFSKVEENHIGVLTEVEQRRLRIKLNSLRPYEVYFVVLYLNDPELGEPVYPARLI